jgi:hypothetical protein
LLMPVETASQINFPSSSRCFRGCATSFRDQGAPASEPAQAVFPTFRACRLGMPESACLEGMLVPHRCPDPWCWVALAFFVPCESGMMGPVPIAVPAGKVKLERISSVRSPEPLPDRTLNVTLGGPFRVACRRSR